MSEWTPAGVLRLSKIGVEPELILEGLEPEWSESQFFNKRLLYLLLVITIADCFFAKNVIT